MKDYLELTKPRITLLVALTTVLGGWVSGRGTAAALAWTALGAALVSAACGTLNQWLEQDVDALMHRTRNRPLPAGRLTSGKAFAFGAALALSGLGLLLWKVNALAAGLTALTLVLYICAYTPMKKLTPHSTWVGAVAGATPPLIGWAGAAGALEAPAWGLFAIQFLWQIPHFLALFWLYREDYARAGFKVMPVVDPGGRLTACQIALHCFALIPASLMPAWSGLAGAAYGGAALVLGSAFLALGMRASWTLAALDARRLFLGSLLYLPTLFGILALGGHA
jgi:protoheme IX farnesyltransferase